MNETVRAQFPILARKIDGQPVVYLDSAATALKPRSVLDAERRNRGLRPSVAGTSATGSHS